MRLVTLLLCLYSGAALAKNQPPPPPPAAPQLPSEISESDQKRLQAAAARLAAAEADADALLAELRERYKLTKQDRVDWQKTRKIERR